MSSEVLRTAPSPHRIELAPCMFGVAASVHRVRGTGERVPDGVQNSMRAGVAGRVSSRERATRYAHVPRSTWHDHCRGRHAGRGSGQGSGQGSLCVPFAHSSPIRCMRVVVGVNACVRARVTAPRRPGQHEEGHREPPHAAAGRARGAPSGAAGQASGRPGRTGASSSGGARPAAGRSRQRPWLAGGRAGQGLLNAGWFRKTRRAGWPE